MMNVGLLNEYRKGSNQMPQAADDFAAEQRLCPRERIGSGYNYRVTL